MCPALMLAVSRNDRVIGRTIVLTVSIITRKGLRGVGAPLGRRCARNFEEDWDRPDKMRVNHKGKPNDRLKTKWLVMLKIYGISPHRFIRIRSKNRGTMKI